MTRMLTLACTMFGLMMASATANDAAPALRPGEVVVVANSANDDSMAVARHYMQRREIPERNLFTLAYEEFGDLEEMDQNPAWWPYEKFRAELVGPLEQFLVERELKDRALCIVMVYGTPFRVGRFKFTEAQERALTEMVEIQPGYEQADADGQREMRKKLRHRLWYANAAVDSELAVLFQSKQQAEPRGDALAGMRARVGFESNPFYEADGDFRAFRQKRIEAGASERLYMVARLDGPTPEVAKGLIDKAIAAEQAGGLTGKYCIDARNDGTKSGGGYAMGDRWLREMAKVCEEAGLDGVYDTRGGSLGEGACPAPAIYWGWYQLFDYRGEIFDHRFPDGAIACHIASFEAARLWKGQTDKQGGPWVAGLLKDGVTVAIGPVSEPYLSAFTRPAPFLQRLFRGEPVAQAYWAATPHVSWRMILIGDPLYRPYPGGIGDRE